MIILGGKGTFPCFLKSTRPYITWVCLLGLRQVSASCKTSPSDGCCVYSNGKACASDGCPANAVCYPVYDCCLRPSHMHAHPSPVFRVVLLLIVYARPAVFAFLWLSPLGLQSSFRIPAAAEELW